MSRSTRRTDLTTLVALALLLGGLGFLLRARAGEPAPSPCDPDRDPGCPVDARAVRAAVPPAGGATPSRVAAGPPRLSADAACRNVSYLCAAVADSGRVQVHRWRDFTGVLVVHVPLPDLPDRARAFALRSAATAGVRLWNGQPFPILVDERGTRKAHVEVRWVPALEGAQIGLTRTAWNARDGLSVRSLELVTASPAGGGAPDAREVRLTAAHEMGHALGLPHSDNPRDLMYPANTATSLTARDYRAIEALYAFEDGTVIVR